MRTSVDCIPCFIGQTLKAISMVTDDQAVHEEVVRKILHLTATMDFNQSPPQTGRTIYRLISEISGENDPYYEIKINEKCS